MSKTLSNLVQVSTGNMTFERLSCQQSGAFEVRLSDGRFDIPSEALSVDIISEDHEQEVFTLAFAGIKRATLADVILTQNMYPLEREVMLAALVRLSYFQHSFAEPNLNECGLDTSRNLYVPRHSKKLKGDRHDGRGRNIFTTTWSINYRGTTSENNGNQATG